MIKHETIITYSVQESKHTLFGGCPDSTDKTDLCKRQQLS